MSQESKTCKIRLDDVKLYRFDVKHGRLVMRAKCAKVRREYDRLFLFRKEELTEDLKDLYLQQHPEIRKQLKEESCVEKL